MVVRSKRRCDEVRGRDGIDELTRVEIDLASRAFIHALDVPDGRKDRLGGNEIALLDVVEDRVLGPIRVFESLVRRLFGFGRTSCPYALRGFLPKRDALVEAVDLGLRGRG